MSATEAFSNNALRRAADFIPQGLAVFNAQLELVVSNDRYRTLLDLPIELVVPGTPLVAIARFLALRGDLGPGDPNALAEQRVHELTSAPTTVSQRPGGDGSGRTLEFHTGHLPDGGLAISFADITARIAAERALESANLSLEGRVAERTAALTRVNAELEAARTKADAANRDKTRFLAAASHDLLQPLNAAKLYTATLIERSGDGAAQELAQSIEASLNAVEDIMTALLEMSRIDSGVLRPAPVNFPVRDLLKRTELELGPMARERGVSLRLVDCSAVTLADRALVARIVQNLVSNAIKYTRSGGRVVVGCRRRGGRLRLDVVDTGIGINRDQHALVFSEFSRLEQGLRMAQGLGLGLSIVKRLVGALGLTLELDSVEGKGSRFSLLLPQGRAHSETIGEAPSRREAPSNLRGLKVLCVDNERPSVEAMAGLLSGWGCEVRLARSLREIDKDQLLEGWLPDLVLMDYHLDQTSGLDAIEWLRHNLGGHLPAALITADRSPEVRALAEERGVPVITKPVKPAALRATISGLAGQSALSPGAGNA